jgi:hypothetical protein
MGRKKKSLQTYTKRRKNNKHAIGSQRQNQRRHAKHPKGAKHALNFFYIQIFKHPIGVKRRQTPAANREEQKTRQLLSLN